MQLARDRPLKPLLAVLAALASSLGSASASAYCRTSVCPPNGDPGTRCVPELPSDCGTALYWAGSCVGFSMQQDGSNTIPIDTVEQLFDEAFNTWENASCPEGGSPAIRIDVLERVECDEVEYNQQNGNTNLIVFRDDQWPHAGQGNTLALTTVTYNLDTGEIFDADMEINGTAELTVGDNDINYDLLSIATHEAGHFLGLAHTQPEYDDATMHVEYIPKTTDLRTLGSDDEAGICAIFPPGTEGTCDPLPRHGFASPCGGNPPEDEGCQCHLERATAQSPWRPWGAAMVVLALVSGRRRCRPS